MLPTLNTNMGNANAEQEALTTSTVEDEPRPRFGLKRRFGTSSFLAAAFALCLVKLSYDVVVTEALTGVNQVFDPYLLCFLEILEVALLIWIYFLHHQSKVQLGAIMALLGAVTPLTFAIGIRCLILALSASQHPSRLNNWQVLSNSSVPAGIQVVAVDAVTYNLVYPLFSNLYTYSKLLLEVLCCLRQLAHPFLKPPTTTQIGLAVGMGIFYGSCALLETELFHYKGGISVVQLFAGVILLLWAPITVQLDRCLIQLRHRKHDSRPQPVICFFGSALLSAAVFSGVLQLMGI